MALLVMFMENNDKLDLNIRACHVNHLLRGDESFRDQHFVEEFCGENDIPIDILEIDVASEAKKRRESVELVAREVRYGFFDHIAKKYNCKIATAHTMSDNTETILFNMTRGTGIDGLLGIPTVRENIIRPIIMYERCEIEAYLKERDISYVDDSTNMESVYSRNKIRLEVVPKLKQINSSVESSISETSGQLGIINDFLEKSTNEFLEKCFINGKYSLDLLGKTHTAIRRKVITKSLSENDLEISSNMIKLIEKIILDGTGKINVSKDFFAVANSEFYYITKIEPESCREPFETLVNIGNNMLYEGKIVKIKCYEESIYKNLENVHASKIKNMIDYDKIVGKLCCRNRKQGDKINLATKGVTKSIKKLFNESKISPEKRDSVAIICDDLGPVWIEGFGSAKRAVCDEFTKKALKIDIIIWEDKKCLTI